MGETTPPRPCADAASSRPAVGGAGCAPREAFRFIPYRERSWGESTMTYQNPFQNPTISSTFAWRFLSGADRFHPGSDVVNPSDRQRQPQTIRAMASGTIAGQFESPDGELIGVLIVGDDGRALLYSGLSVNNRAGLNGGLLAVGTHINAGDPIGV